MTTRSIAWTWIWIALASCGGDDGGGESTGIASASDTGTGSSGTSGAASSSGDGGASSSGGVDASSSGAADSSSGGVAEDPEYPAPQGGTCPQPTVPVELPGASSCAPTCAGADAPCPAAASGDATGVCTPFEQEGGSGTPCTEHADCTGGEACGGAGTCVAVAFWGCRLRCSDGASCPDAMICAGDSCGYP